MRAATRLGYEELAGSAEKSLQRLGFRYLRNEARGVMEFEILSPARFRVLVEEGLNEETRYSFLASEKRVCWIEVRRDLEGEEPDEAITRSVSSFARDLIASLPESPWRGFGFLRSRRERLRWAGLGTI